MCSRLETGTTSQLMGNNMESGNSDQMYEGFLDSIHNTLQHNGSCDKPDLPWLLTTYVSTKKAGEKGDREKRACQNWALSEWISRGQGTKISHCIYTE